MTEALAAAIWSNQRLGRAGRCGSAERHSRPQAPRSRENKAQRDRIDTEGLGMHLTGRHEVEDDACMWASDVGSVVLPAWLEGCTAVLLPRWLDLAPTHSARAHAAIDASRPRQRRWSTINLHTLALPPATRPGRCMVWAYASIARCRTASCDTADTLTLVVTSVITFKNDEI